MMASKAMTRRTQKQIENYSMENNFKEDGPKMMAPMENIHFLSGT